ncbi:MAG: ECF transporter S component [Lachnospiraceae bacterium]|jgi:riboflavin transporter FmnP|nr:ECF transporter S component [Lachnospiraceae bacterium]
MKKRVEGSSKVRRMVLVAMLGAISAILMFFSVAVPFVPPFITFDFSELPIIIAGFVLGPVDGLVTIVIKLLLKLIYEGTQTAGVGELMNFCVSALYMLPSVLIYHKIRSKKGAAISMAVGTVIVSIMAVLINYFIMFPVYAWAARMPMATLVDMGTKVNPKIDSLFTMMVWAVLPFNLLKYTVLSLTTFLVYKRLAGFMRNMILK